MRVDARFWKSVETLGHGQFSGIGLVATDGAHVFVQVSHPEQDQSDHVARLITKDAAKKLGKEMRDAKQADTQILPDEFAPGEVLNAVDLANMAAKFEGIPACRFVIDWDLLSKAVKCLTAHTKGIPAMIVDVYLRDGVAYYMLQLRGDPTATAYVAGMLENLPAAVETPGKPE